MKKILDRCLYYIFWTVTWIIVNCYFRLKVQDRENIPKKGPFIVVSNHTSFLDPVVVYMTIPINVSWIAKKAVFDKKGLSLINRLCDSIPVNGAVDAAVRALAVEHRVVGIFPEGTRSRDGRIKPADVGVAILALRSGVPVVPIGIVGTFEAFGPDAVFPRPHRVTLRIGKPFLFARIDSQNIGEETLRQKTDFIMERIKELLPDQ